VPQASHQPIIETLLGSSEPSIVYKVRVGALGEAPDSVAIQKLRNQIRQSPRVRALLAGRDSKGRIPPANHPYKKWDGAHWVFAALADLGYPPGDKSIVALRNQVLDCWLNPPSIEDYECKEVDKAHRRPGVPVINGRARRCASQQGNALYASVALGFVDDRCRQLAECLLRWQWPDGGWNCDCSPKAHTSSFWESHLPLRGLAIWSKNTVGRRAAKAAKRAAEVFLSRFLFQRLRDGKLMNPQFTRLHYPVYWRYDILHALKVLAEAGLISDPRCVPALRLLESKRLPDGGWPAEERFYNPTANRKISGAERVAWGGVSTRKMNEWVTADALTVLAAAGRLHR
jgi:hypothetical protein